MSLSLNQQRNAPAALPLSARVFSADVDGEKFNEAERSRFPALNERRTRNGGLRVAILEFSVPSADRQSTGSGIFPSNHIAMWAAIQTGTQPLGTNGDIARLRLPTCR